MAPWPPVFGHLTPDLPALNRAICLRAVHDLAICETPPSSNRSGRIDEYNRRATAPVGSSWCASWATAVWEDCGADVPPRARASCDTIVSWAKREGLWRSDPVPGAMVLYTNGKTLPSGELDAVHVGIVIRTTPQLLSMEGNAAFSGFSANGEAVVLKKIDTARVMGYAHPRARAAQGAA